MNPAARPPPTTFEAIEAVALRHPRRLALVQNTQSWTYNAFYLDLIRVVRVLAALGVERGQRVAVGAAGLQAGLLLLIAAENLGAVTTSFLPENDPDADVLFGMVDWVFSDAPQACPATARFVLLDPGFLQRVVSIDPADGASYPRLALELHGPQRISRTSGSSGRSKFVLLTRAAQEHWVGAGAESGGYGPHTRLLVAGPLVMNAVFARSCACLRLGAAVLDLAGSGLQGHEITHIHALPLVLNDILNQLPEDYVPTCTIDVATVGGFLPAELRQRAMRVFGGRVANRYGTNESSSICDDLDASGTGVVNAGVDVRIVDEDGNGLAHGEPGIVEVRTCGMADGYIGDDGASQAAFRGGWFHTGDWGMLLGPRLLRLVGRHDDLVNIGGIKLPAAHFEAHVREIASAPDCAVLAVNLHDGAVTLAIAVVATAATDRDSLLARVQQEMLPDTAVGAKVVFVDALPRMPNGKLDRIALRRLFVQSA